MNNDILKDIYLNKEEEFQNKQISELIKNNPDILDEYPILEIEFNRDGSKKSIYYLANEKDIKIAQANSDLNELEYKYSQGKISKKEYEDNKEEIEKRLINQNLVYDDLIFDIINKEDLELIKSEIKDYNLNEIDLRRLSDSLSSIAENKINEFQENNKEFRKDKISYWNYKYDLIAKSYAKARELEGFIRSLIE